jgi:hypothetical protein
VSSLFWRVICQSARHEGKRSKKMWPFFLFVTRGGISHGNKKSSFPFFLHWYKVCRIIRRTSYRPYSIPMTFRVEFGFLVAQFNSPYLLHSSSYDFSCRIGCIPKPNFPSVEKSSHDCLSHECGGFWPHLAFWDVWGSPWRRFSSIVANVAAIYDEVASAPHRCGYFENAVSSSSALAAL